MDSAILVDLSTSRQGRYHAGMDPPWEHPDWYDLHDTAWTAGSEREPEHYRELVLALPPLGREDHLVDVGAGTGKLAALIARGYPRLGRVTLLEPNADKAERAVARVREILRAAAEAAGHPVAIAIWFGPQRVFHTALPGASADNDGWLDRKHRAG